MARTTSSTWERPRAREDLDYANPRSTGPNACPFCCPTALNLVWDNTSNRPCPLLITQKEHLVTGSNSSGFQDHFLNLFHSLLLLTSPVWPPGLFTLGVVKEHEKRQNSECLKFASVLIPYVSSQPYPAAFSGQAVIVAEQASFSICLLPGISVVAAQQKEGEGYPLISRPPPELSLRCSIHFMFDLYRPIGQH